MGNTVPVSNSPQGYVEGSDILVVFLQLYGVGQGLQPNVGGLDTGYKEWTSVGCDDFVGPGSNNHG